MSAKLLYDKRGAVLFEKICEQPEYYPTDTELDILRTCADEISAVIGPAARVVEPGSGEGIKTKLLLSKLSDPRVFVPLDISRAQLEDAAHHLNESFPDLRVQPICADFHDEFDLPPDEGVRKTSVFFPGSTIGNMEPDEARDLLRRFAAFCRPDGGILIGVDLEKPPAIVEPAYDDDAGVSAAFALNVLQRLNRELDGDFDPDQFRYEAPYDSEHHRIEMGLVSRVDQTVHVAGEAFDLRAGEKIITEYSYKFTLERFADLARSAGLRVSHVWCDPKRYFSVQYLTPVTRGAAG